MRYKTYTGVVLKKTAWREADEILTTWTMEEGKIRLLARGLKHPTSKLRAGLAPLSWIEFSTSSALGFPVIIGSRSIHNYNAILQSLPKLASAFNIFEYVLKSTPDRQASPELSVLLREAFNALDVMEEKQLTNFLNAFLARFITTMGFGLSLSICTMCGQTVAPSMRVNFSHLQCGLVCDRCVSGDRTAVTVLPRVIMYILSLQAATQFLGKTEAGAEVVSGAKKLLSETMRFILEREIQSSRFFEARVAQDTF